MKSFCKVAKIGDFGTTRAADIKVSHGCDSRVQHVHCGPTRAAADQIECSTPIRSPRPNLRPALSDSSWYASTNLRTVGGWGSRIVGMISSRAHHRMVSSLTENAWNKGGCGR